MLSGRINDFVRKVENAFADSPYPGDDNIVYQNDLKLNVDDAIEAFKSFKGKHWQEIPLETLIANRDHLPFFTPEAYSYYLPAYMLASILHFDIVDVLTNNTLYSLTPPESDDSRKDRFLNRVKDFSPIQRAAISEFLALYAQLDPYSLMYDLGQSLQRAIEFWEDFDK